MSHRVPQFLGRRLTSPGLTSMIRGMAVHQVYVAGANQSWIRSIDDEAAQLLNILIVSTGLPQI